MFHSNRFAVAAVFLLACLMHLQGIFDAPLAGNEPLRAIAACEMLHEGGWAVPRIFDAVYGRKPPMINWLEAGSEWIFGPHEFAWRLPTVIGSGVLAAACAAASGAWFGRRGGVTATWAGGLAALLIVPFWDQAKNANIDLLNTAATIITAFGFVFLFRAKSNRAAVARSAVLTIFAACMLLLKGPVGLLVAAPVLVAGVAIYRPKRLQLALAIVAVAIAIAAFAGWVEWAKMTLAARGWQIDRSGIDEAVMRLYPSSVGDFLRSLLTGPTLFAYGIPVSLCLLAVGHPRMWRHFSDDEKRVIRTLVWAIVGGLAILLLTGTTNPRHGFGLLPLLVPLAAAVVSAAGRCDDVVQKRIASTISLSATLVFILTIVVTALAWNDSINRVAGVAAVIVGGVAIWRVFVSHARHRPGGVAGGIVLLLLAASVPSARLYVQKQIKNSAIHAAPALAKLIPEGETVTAGMAVFSKPELFWYAGVKMHVPRLSPMSPDDVARPGYAVLHETEMDAWKAAGRDAGMTILDTLMIDHHPLYVVHLDSP